MADTADLKSAAPYRACGFESRSWHQFAASPATVPCRRRKAAEKSGLFPPEFSIALVCAFCYDMDVTTSERRENSI